MASILLRRALFSLSKPLSFVSYNASHYSSMCFSGFSLCSSSKTLLPLSSSVFLASSNLLPIQQVLGMKTKVALKKRCKDCYFVKRRGRLFVYCKSNGKHKQRQA